MYSLQNFNEYLKYQINNKKKKKSNAQLGFMANCVQRQVKIREKTDFKQKNPGKLLFLKYFFFISKCILK